MCTCKAGLRCSTSLEVGRRFWKCIRDWGKAKGKVASKIPPAKTKIKREF
jgi:hypothetical protein